MEVDRETDEEKGKKWIREEEKEENETVIVKRRCVNPVSTEASDIFSQGEDSESCGKSWPGVIFLMILVVSLTVILGTWMGLPVVTDVLCPPPRRWLRCVQMFLRTLSGIC